MKARLAARLVALAASAVASPATAEPQVHAGLRGSACHLVPRGEPSTRFCSGIVLDAHFGRERNRDVGFGPMLAVSTAGFWDVRVGGGGSLLIPVHPDVPFVLGGGVYAHETKGVSLGANLFWGFRSYNFHGTYNLGSGLFAEVLQDLDADRATVLALGFELDALVLALPFFWLGG